VRHCIKPLATKHILQILSQTVGLLHAADASHRPAGVRRSTPLQQGPLPNTHIPLICYVGLHCGLLQMQAIGLLVFDEAHHCSRDHPYAQIMEDFYHTTEPQHRPQVLGLTASPKGLHGSSKKRKKGRGGGAAAASLTAGWDLQQRLAAPLLTVAPDLRCGDGLEL
jgi:hypothetical protein